VQGVGHWLLQTPLSQTSPEVQACGLLQTKQPEAASRSQVSTALPEHCFAS
jgi:hypothetical protein